MSSDQQSHPVMLALTKSVNAELVASTNDICLLIDDAGVVIDVVVNSDDPGFENAQQWVGKRWEETVSIESKKKIADLLSGDEKTNNRWRQVNHPDTGDLDLPVTYKTVQLDDGRIMAIGREMRQVSLLQQRLLDVQHSLESDYARLHQAEVRYRMLFSLSSESILCVDAESRRILEANPAAAELLGGPVNKLINRSFPRGFSDNSHDKINALLTRVQAAGVAEEVMVTTARDAHSVVLSASLVRKGDGPYFLLRIQPAGQSSSDGISHRVIDVVNRSPDSFVVTTADGTILAANLAFMNLVSIATDLQLVKQPLDRWLGRRGTDVALLLRNLPERGEIRQFDTIVRPEFGEAVDVELSAVSALDTDNPCLGFVIRQRNFKRPSASPPKPDKDAKELPHSLQEMTELVGRVPLKDLIRETTDIIEHMCIEAALKLSNQSRASAAEMLGLSRQSLYVKLRRYGIGDNDADNNG